MDKDFDDLDSDSDDFGSESDELITLPDEDNTEIVWGNDDPVSENEDEDDKSAQQANEQGAEEDEEDDSAYGKKVQKRIGKLLGQRQEERAARLAAEQENARLRQELEQARATHAQVSAENIDAEIEKKMAKYREVRAEFDPDKGDEEANLLLEVAELRQRKADLQRQAPRRAESSAPPQQAPQAPAQPQGPGPKAREWMGRNEWYGKPGHEATTAAASAIDQALYREGYDPNSSEYFAELDRRLRKTVRVPTSESPRRETQRTVLDGDRNLPPRSRNRVVLTAADQERMRRLKLDPSNPQHAKHYAREKLAMERQRG